jgi:hypothetical protein
MKFCKHWWWQFAKWIIFVDSSSKHVLSFLRSYLFIMWSTHMKKITSQSVLLCTLTHSHEKMSEKKNNFWKIITFYIFTEGWKMWHEFRIYTSHRRRSKREIKNLHVTLILWNTTQTHSHFAIMIEMMILKFYPQN